MNRTPACGPKRGARLTVQVCGDGTKSIDKGLLADDFHRAVSGTTGSDKTAAQGAEQESEIVHLDRQTGPGCSIRYRNLTSLTPSGLTLRNSATICVTNCLKVSCSPSLPASNFLMRWPGGQSIAMTADMPA